MEGVKEARGADEAKARTDAALAEADRIALPRRG